MTEQERNSLMDRLEELKDGLAEAVQEAEDARHRVSDLEVEIMKVENQFPECRYWRS